ncbi:G-protein coupled receptor protein [Purpureocillium lilacinum]|uniref:G-protein coupled receptor protein n=1 Tax=Purpureocillium lilacinum TaxID=33203 RepID=A0A179HDY7_PURLI|nr:G-protein coupled receptor protein [Purpureocillium lilacinum]KAK4091105.1 hypothetical protein Purlil1_4685 [Purpureocillium lilacinum]OAQ87828.1 G-protein coupled receptor protein [Purpureocillium lilacinum]OAQ89873.1 G-protein coupled receptor protein [Purpureocillium lilacinum]PWI68364.1 hypothetical protein PCL_02133 [Purpureocillium lilacinum]
MASKPTTTALPTAEQFTPQQVNTLATLERVGGSISLFGVLCIFVTYACVRRVRNVQNTFIVFASVANVGASVASIIALNGLQAGKASALCKTQSFLFEMFMQSDPWWSLAMAVNVFLVFYYRASPDSFRRWWWVYCLICYGGPFVIALALLLVNHPQKGPIYGEATIWCWIDPKWDSIRIYTYYMLIWICIVGSMLCYFLVGYHVFRSRNQLHSFSQSRTRDAGHLDQKLGLDQYSNAGGFYGTVVTEVKVVHTSASVEVINNLSTPKAARLIGGIHDASSPDSAERPPTRRTMMDQSANDATGSRHYYSTVTAAAPERRPSPSLYARIRVAGSRLASKFVVDDPIKRAYLRTSLLFAVSVFVTWIPSSLNRINGWLHGTSPFQYHLATAAVLPLQGLWNFLIFFITSWRVVRKQIRGAGGGRHGGRYGTGGSQRSRDDGAGGYGPGTAVDRTADREHQRVAGSHPLAHARSNQQYSHTYRGSDSDLGDGESLTMGSEVELRGLPQAPTKMSTSL